VGEKFEIGDRVEYPEHMKFQLGAERHNEQGEVVDLITGEAGVIQIVYSKPDSFAGLLDESVPVRMDLVMVGATSPTVRKLK